MTGATAELSPFCGAKPNVVPISLRRQICALLRSHQHGIMLATVSKPGKVFCLLNPLVAAFIHVASGVTSILNSTRILVPPDRSARAMAEAELKRPDQTWKRPPRFEPLAVAEI